MTRARRKIRRPRTSAFPSQFSSKAHRTLLSQKSWPQRRIMVRRIILFGVLLLSLNAIGFAQTRARVTPDALVRNLYAARRHRATDPFLQTKPPPRLYKYFMKDLAELIWKDAASSSAKNEVGALDGDPLYNAQDMKITAFRIKPPEYGEGNRDLADVPVTFKNFGKEETVLV